MEKGYVDAIIGAQMGDEGKGRFTHDLAGSGNYAAVARFNGGANAGHTVEIDGVEVNTHQVPSGVSYDGVLNLITQSSYVDPVELLEEIGELEEKGLQITPENFRIARGANLVLPSHIILDQLRETNGNGQGSTKRGISFVAADKYGREGVLASDFYADPSATAATVTGKLDDAYEQAKAEHVAVDSSAFSDLVDSWEGAMEELAPFFTDTTEEVHQLIGRGANVLAEGAQSSGLDIEHGIRPQGTSSHVTIGGVLNSLGVGPRVVRNVYGVAKLTKSRVGGTPDSFPTMIHDEELAENIRGQEGTIDYEAGKSTGRKRMVGWLDIPELRQAARVNGFTELFVTKLDCVPQAGETTKIATSYRDQSGNPVLYTPTTVREAAALDPRYTEHPTWGENISDITDFNQLPTDAKHYIHAIERYLGLSITRIGVGPARHQVIVR